MSHGEHDDLPCWIVGKLRSILFKLRSRLREASRLEESRIFDANLLIENKKRKQEFTARFAVMNLEERLRLHGTKKLLILAKKYNVKGRSKLSREKLIDTLCHVASVSDFPIRASPPTALTHANLA